jgi:hypothetical protein
MRAPILAGHHLNGVQMRRIDWKKTQTANPRRSPKAGPSNSFDKNFAKTQGTEPARTPRTGYSKAHHAPFLAIEQFLQP